MGGHWGDLPPDRPQSSVTPVGSSNAEGDLVMELRVLRYFLMAAREENITHAAQLLHVTQPTLSRQLQDLEEELGTKLFERSNHRIILTQDGLLLRRRAQEIVELADRTKRDFVRREAELCGEVAIGSGETRSMSALAQILASFRQAYPRVRYRFYSGNADHIKERMENGTLDMGLMPEPVDIAKYEFLRVPVMEEWGVLTREDSPLGRLKAVRPEDLAGRPLMLSGREAVQNELANWLGASLDELDIRIRYNLLYNVAMLVKNGFGDALCIRLDCAYPGLRFVPLSPALRFGSLLAWKRRQAVSPAVDALLRHAKKYLEGISDYKE